MRKGISLIVLIITILVIIILSGAIILSLVQNNPIGQANEATFKADLDSYKSELAVSMSNEYLKNYTFKAEELNATTWDGVSSVEGTVKYYIPSMKAEYAKDFEIENGKLVYVGTNTKYKEWANQNAQENNEPTPEPTGPYIEDGLIMWLDGDDFSNSPATTVWLDRSGNNINGTATFFNYNASSGSDNNGAVVFDGVDDAIELPLLPAQTDEELSFFAWINWKGVTATGPSGIWGHYGVDDINSHFEIYDVGMRLRLGDMEKAKMLAPDLNTWVQVGFVYDKTSAKYYINGVLVDSFEGTTGPILGDRRHIIGTSDYGRMFNGSIANALLYNRALTQEEITHNYQAGY